MPKPIRLLLLLPLLCASLLSAQGAGRIEGTIKTEGGSGLGGVAVTLQPLRRTALSDPEGAFTLIGVPAGSYTIDFRLAEFAAEPSAVVVRAGEVTRVDKTFEWDFSFADTITVESASRRRERLVEAPAAVTRVAAEEAALEGGAGQIPTLFMATAGVEIIQSGLYDINFNTRGFNGFLTRRIQTLIDGRDAAIPETSGQDWWPIGFLKEDLAALELVRGPSAALYGANSVNGVLSLTTKAPRASQGGKLRLTAGDLDTLMGDLRWAGGFGGDWYLKALGNHTQSDSYTRPRTEAGEYEGLPLEVVAPDNRVDFDSASLRLDRDFSRGDLLTVEAGSSEGGGETIMTQAGRVKQLDRRRSWGRLNYNAAHWNLSAHFNDSESIALSRSAGVEIFTNSSNLKLELQGNKDLAAGRFRLIGGASYLEEDVDSADDRGRQTLYFEPIETDAQAVFGQFEADLSDDLKLVLAARWDDSTLHDPELSPKASLVYAPTGNHTFRFGYNQGFQAGNYTEIFLSIPAAPPLDLSLLEDLLAPLLGGVPLGLDFIPILAFGNRDLAVEKIRSFEIGYHGILGKKAYLTVDYYRSRIEDFISDLGPGINPAFPPYRAPSALPPEAAALVESTLNGAVPGLTNGPAGEPELVFSNANTGKADTQGLEVAFAFQPRERWLLDFSYSWFDFDIREETGGANPNAPESTAGFRAAYRHGDLAASLRYRWVDRFDWASGIFVGTVPSYQVVNVDLGYDISDRWEVGLNVSNVLNEAHFQAFGADLLARRALGFVAVSW